MNGWIDTVAKEYYIMTILFFREIAQLRKDHRKKENLIKTLQADARRKEMVLKRKQEEVQTITLLSLSILPLTSSRL